MDEHVCVGGAAAAVVGEAAAVVGAAAGAAAEVVGVGVLAAEAHCEALAWYNVLLEQQYTDGS